MPSLSDAVEHGPLREQILAAVEAFADEDGLAPFVASMLDDVERVLVEPLEVFPVAHHSPASAVQMVRRLRERPPRLIFLEGCEDMGEHLSLLRPCKLPVAIQAFAMEGGGFPASWYPLSVSMPFTEFSAEFQAIAFAMDAPDCDVIFVDRSSDRIFQRLAEERGEEGATPDVPVEIGRVEPTLASFERVLLTHARVRHFQEWWYEYVERPLVGASFDTYRQVMCLVASMLRRLGRKPAEDAENVWREGYMWTRIKQVLAARGVAPEEAIFVCGALHAVSPVPAFGTRNDERIDTGRASGAAWSYGVLPTHYAAIERQFHHPVGTIAMAEGIWQRACSALKVKPFKLARKEKSRKTRQRKVKSTSSGVGLLQWLKSPPELDEVDDHHLVRWCVDIVKLARKNGYIASTADAIAIYEHAILLARMRGRVQPTPYDFMDAAVTCLEKGRVPKEHDIAHLCTDLLGGDREGLVGFAALPVLVKDVIRRLEPIGFTATTRRVHRAIFDLRTNPELKPCSDLLWCLHYLLRDTRALEPIVGRCGLGVERAEESWDIRFGKREGQKALITLAYEGMVVEQVLRDRLWARAHREQAHVVDVLEGIEAWLMYLGEGEERLRGLEERAVAVMSREENTAHAPQVLARTRRLATYYRVRDGEAPTWMRDFMVEGFRTYAALLPNAFEDRGTRPEEVAAMLGFLLGLGDLAQGVGGDSNQIRLALEQATTVTADPEKLGLLESALMVTHGRDASAVEGAFEAVLLNPLLLASLAGKVRGYLMSADFNPRILKVVMRGLTLLFDRLPPERLRVWLPELIVGMHTLDKRFVRMLVRDAARTFPGTLAALDQQKLRGTTRQQASAPEALAVRGLLGQHSAAVRILGRRIGCADFVVSADAVRQGGPLRTLLAEYPAAAHGLGLRIGLPAQWEMGSPAQEEPLRELLERHPASRVVLQQRLR